MTESNLTVVGAGTMGHGIAQVAAMAGYRVHLFDLSDDALRQATAAIRSSLERFVEKGRLDAASRDAALNHITPTGDLVSSLSNADIVIEAVPEDLTLKLEIFETIDRNASEHALLATNTSSLSITEIAAATSRPHRVIGLHFFNPVPLMKLLEIVRGMRTEPAAVTEARTLAERLEKEVVLVNDWPGFASSRLGIALGAEAIRMVEQGVASPADIDRAMELGYRHPMGPLKLSDLIGLDVRLAIMEHLHRELGEQFRPPTLLRQMVRAGKLGRKAGEGFYRYDT